VSLLLLFHGAAPVSRAPRFALLIAAGGLLSGSSRVQNMTAFARPVRARVTFRPQGVLVFRPKDEPSWLE
jgi:hypothetical protein